VIPTTRIPRACAAIARARSWVAIVRLSPVVSCQSKGAREMNRVEGSELGRHRLGRAVQDGCVDYNQMESPDDRQNRRTSHRNLGVIELCSNAKTVEATKTFGLISVLEMPRSISSHSGSTLDC
jgi:hypothetical protein